jgi:membrane-bound lytic murein transglycosylase B
MGFVGRVLLIVGATVVGLAVVAAIVFLAWPDARTAVVGTPAAPAPTWAPPAPVVAATSPSGPGIAPLADPTWISVTAKKTGIPARALEAYAGASIADRTQQPGCGIGWNLLAGVGEVESRHGTIFGGTITANGDAVPPIFGVDLDGKSTAHIPDSDGGAIDGDPTGDRAVGPMQLIPQAWSNWHVDGNGDGVENPQNIDDATLAAAHYLCRAGGDLTSESGWRTAVLAYNDSDAYLAEVARYATGYASAAK